MLRSQNINYIFPDVTLKMTYIFVERILVKGSVEQQPHVGNCKCRPCYPLILRPITAGVSIYGCPYLVPTHLLGTEGLVRDTGIVHTVVVIGGGHRAYPIDPL